MTIVDPPSGWRYGFPAQLKPDYRQQLIDAGYHKRDIELALKYSWYSEEVDKEHGKT